MEGISAGSLLADRYRLVARIGAGGFGETWRAHDEVLELPVALKIIHEPDARRRLRCLEEARALARFRSDPAIVGVANYLESDEYVLLVLEYLDGQSLQAHLEQEGRIPLERALRMLSPVAKAVSHMNDEGMLHRDISPENIIVLADGTARLIDFGSVLASSDKQRKTIMVKPGYAPPEQHADPSEQGAWTDVYALAATIYRCITGQVPLDSLQRSFHDELPAPSVLGVEMPPEAEATLMQALAPDYRQRTKSIDSLMRGLGIDFREHASEQQAAQRDAVAFPSTTKGKRERNGTVPPKTRGGKERDEGKKKEGRNANGRKVARILGIAVAAALLVIAILAIRSCDTGAMDNPYRSNSSTSEVKEANVTPEVLEAIGRDEGTKRIFMYKCMLDDEDIGQIAAMTNIDSLELQACTGFTTLGPLAQCENLQSLTISMMADLDCASVFDRDFPHLAKLELDTVHVANDGGFLGRFPALESLDISLTEGIEDTAPIATMEGLQEAALSGIDLSGDKSAIFAACPALTRVEVDACDMDDLDWAASCPKLVILRANNNNISSLAPLQDLENLKEAYLASNAIADLSPLEKSAPNLTMLYAGDNAITSVQPLAGAARLHTLVVNGNAIADASALSGCTKLKRLGIASNGLQSLDFCASLVELEQLDASHNGLSDSSPLTNCSALKEILLQDNQIGSIDFLMNDFTDLSVLNIADNHVPSLLPLENCPALQRLIAYDNEITTLDGLEGKTELWALLANSNRIADISALSTSTKHLEYLDLGHNAISDISALSGLFSTGTTPGTIRVSGGGIWLFLEHNDITSITSLPTDKRYSTASFYGNPLADTKFFENDNAQWDILYLPYTESLDPAALRTTAIQRDTFIVDVPLDRQAALLRDSNAFPAELITGEQADAQLAGLRAQLYDMVSGKNQDSENADA